MWWQNWTNIAKFKNFDHIDKVTLVNLGEYASRRQTTEQKLMNWFLAGLLTPNLRESLKSLSITIYREWMVPHFIYEKSMALEFYQLMVNSVNVIQLNGFPVVVREILRADSRRSHDQAVKTVGGDHQSYQERPTGMMEALGRSASNRKRHSQSFSFVPILLQHTSVL